MYYLQHEKTGEYVAAIIKLRGEESAYAVYFGPNPSVPSWKTESAARKALDRLLDCAYTNPRGVALDLVIVNPEEKKEVAHMNEMAAAQASAPARSLMEIEADILAQKRTIGRSIVIIGQDLIEAKSKMEHGFWGAWLEERVNFSQSTAENYMKIAEQVGGDSMLLNLPYTKILALLAVPAEEREEFATDNHVEDKSVAQIKQLIRERDEARQEAAAAKAQSEKDSSYFDKLAKLNDQQENKIFALEKQLEKERAKEPDTVTVEKEVPPADYELIKTQLKNTREMLEETEDELAQAQVERDMAMQELEAEKMNGSDPLDVTPFCEACAGLLNKLFAAPVAGDFFRTKTDAELERYSTNITLIMEWAVKTQTVVENIRDERAGFPDAFEIAL